jgi:ABC-type sugar transport system substrate-binding protein
MKNTLLRLCAAGIVLLGSLVPATAADSKLIVAMLPKSKGNAYFISVKAGADKAAKELGIQLLFDGPTDSNAAKQNEIVENWITLGVDVIAVAAENKEGISTALRKAQKQGIKVVTFDADAIADARSFFVNQATPSGIGYSLMDEAARLTGGEGEFAMIVATLTAANQREWQKHIEDRLKEKYPKMKLVAVRPCDDLKDKAQSETTALLSANPNLKLVMAICSPGVPGAAEAVKPAERDLGGPGHGSGCADLDDLDLGTNSIQDEQACRRGIKDHDFGVAAGCGKGAKTHQIDGVGGDRRCRRSLQRCSLVEDGDVVDHIAADIVVEDRACRDDAGSDDDGCERVCPACQRESEGLGRLEIRVASDLDGDARIRRASRNCA